MYDDRNYGRYALLKFKMQFLGNFQKMTTSIINDVVHYELRLQSESPDYLSMNDLIGKEINLIFQNVIECIKCGDETKKSYNQGFCYGCFLNAPESSPCIINPELCKAHLGEGRNLDWEERNHNQPHIVYLAVSDCVKVGVTRKTQVPTRWIDQGAAYAIRLAEVSNRYTAGIIEVALKSQFTDRTNWRKMLQNEVDSSIDLTEIKWELEELLPADLAQYITENDEIIYLNYPVKSFPSKVNSISFDKESVISGNLIGIKGQYLIFENGNVFNVRKHSGYKVKFEY